jgi:hypothetical protein
MGKGYFDSIETAWYPYNTLACKEMKKFYRLTLVQGVGL